MDGKRGYKKYGEFAGMVGTIEYLPEDKRFLSGCAYKIKFEMGAVYAREADIVVVGEEVEGGKDR